MAVDGFVEMDSQARGIEEEDYVESDGRSRQLLST